MLLEKLKKAIYEDSQYIMIQKLKGAEKRGSRAGKKLKEIIRRRNK